MKKYILTALTAISLLSCEQETIEPAQPQVDCNCDRVMSHTKFFLPQGIQFGEYVTINDCTGVQVNGNWSTNSGDVEPVNGECL